MQYYEFISNSDVILRTGGGEGVKKGRNFAYVLNGCSLRIGRCDRSDRSIFDTFPTFFFTIQGYKDLR